MTVPPSLLPVSQRSDAARFLTASADGMVIMWHGPSMTPLRWLSFGLPVASISLAVIRMT